MEMQKKKILYFKKLALVQHRPDVLQTELTDVMVTDISLPRFPPVQPYEYVVDAEMSAATPHPQTTIFCHNVFWNAGSV